MRRIVSVLYDLHMEVSLIIIVLYKAELSFGSQLKQCFLLLWKLIYLFKKTGRDKNINRNKCSLKPMT